MIKRFALLAATLLLPATPALADEGVFSSDVVALMSTQAELHKIADRFDDGAGFGGVYVDAPSKTLHVYWKGQAPQVPTPPGLKVQLHEAKFTQAELRAESRRIAGSGVSILGVGPEHDGSGLVVKVASAPVLRQASASQIPVEFETSGPLRPAASRGDDTAPYKGGAYIRNGQYDVECSLGFAVVTKDTGEDRGLTARHCGGEGTPYFTQNGTKVGTVTKEAFMWDGALITADAAVPESFQPRVWIGDAINGGNQYTLGVSGAAATLPGDFLCTSGAFSGTVCQIRANRTGVSIPAGPGMYHDMVEAIHTGGYAAAGVGDSGGPVFSVATGDQLTARGTIAMLTTGDDVRPCPGVPSSSERECSQRFWFPDITKQLDALGARIKTVS